MPRGVADGLVVLSESADFAYKCDNIYGLEDEIVVRGNDPELGINWKLENPSPSARDFAAPLLKDIPSLPVCGRV